MPSPPLAATRIVKNDFCSHSDLKNEASVEAWFVDPLLAALGWTKKDISLKTAIREFKVGKGSKSALYKPDYILSISGTPAVIVDAKAPSEAIDEYEYQCSSYCLEINKSFDFNPVQLFVLTNGLKTNVYRWDVRKPILTLSFEDFVAGKAEFKALRAVLSKAKVAGAVAELRKTLEGSPFEFAKTSLKELGQTFRRLHQAIWTKEKKSPNAAFEELMKVIFVKIEKDKAIYAALGPDPKPKYEDVVFSSHWIASQTENESPVNDPLFRNLAQGLEAAIQAGTKKRIFDKDERINLSAETIRGIVKEIEHIDFAGMEEDVHGRMFESFLDATVRGRELGQFFTPRDVVSLMVALADIQVTKAHVDTVLDACCGSGGFLITAMSQMTAKANALAGLSNTERNKVLARIRNESLYGIDAGSDPAIHRIARMNMYLHGDGGSHIYFADALDKTLGEVGPADIEEKKQLKELRSLFVDQHLRFSVILSNPPFSLKYTRDDQYQSEILGQYSSKLQQRSGKLQRSLLSSVMFLERYHDLVADGGRILAIIDESVLSGESYAEVRNYIREHFIIVGVISLPGDAFRRAAARVKTSILILRKRIDGESQPDVFMAAATSIGLEEKVARRIGIAASTLEATKDKEVDRIVSDFRKFSEGKSGAFVVPAKNLTDRLDVKYCVNDRGRKAAEWKKKGLAVTTLGKVLTVAGKRSIAVSASDVYQFLRVTYEGDVIEGELIEGEDCSYNKLFSVKPWDLLLSNMGVGRGAIGIVPPFHEGKLVSNEYTILRAATKEEAVYYSNLLRTKEILGDILASATGMNRGRIKWDSIAKVIVPEYTANPEIAALTKDLDRLWSAHGVYAASRSAHIGKVAEGLGIDGVDAHHRWLAYKPPE